MQKAKVKFKIKNFQKLKLISRVLFLIISFLFSEKVLAQEEIKISIAPEFIEQQVGIGETEKGFLKINNKSKVAIPMEIGIENFSAEEGSGNVVFEQDELAYDVSRWIKFEKPNFILEPEETLRLNFSISAPAGVNSSGAYAMVFFEPRLPSYYFKEDASKVIPKIGVPFLLYVGADKNQQLSNNFTFLGFNVPEKFRLNKLEEIFGFNQKAIAGAQSDLALVNSSQLFFNLGIQNNDIFHIRAKGKVVVMKDGKNVGETVVKNVTVLPGKTRNFLIDFLPRKSNFSKKYLPDWFSDFVYKNFIFGKYQANLSLAVGNKNIEQTTEFFVFPWQIILSTIIACGIVLLFVVKYKKRIASAIKILIKK